MTDQFKTGDKADYIRRGKQVRIISGDDASGYLVIYTHGNRRKSFRVAAGELRAWVALKRRDATPAALCTCQVCGRAVKASRGKIAHHGFERPGTGWQTASCFGAGFVPYEIGRDALPLAIEAARLFIDQQHDAIGRLLSGEVLPARSIDYRGCVSMPSSFRHMIPREKADENNSRAGIVSADYADLCARTLAKLQTSIRSVEFSIDELHKRFDSWKPPA